MSLNICNNKKESSSVLYQKHSHVDCPANNKYLFLLKFKLSKFNGKSTTKPSTKTFYKHTLSTIC